MRTHRDRDIPAGTTDPIPVISGMLALGGNTALCCACGWRGVPVSVGPRRRKLRYREVVPGVGQDSPRCPRCQIAPDTDSEYAIIAADDAERMKAKLAGARASLRTPRVKVAVSRNAPCPCGSGVKAKKCPCVEYSV